VTTSRPKLSVAPAAAHPGALIVTTAPVARPGPAIPLGEGLKIASSAQNFRRAPCDLRPGTARDTVRVVERGVLKIRYAVLPLLDAFIERRQLKRKIENRSA
jgi:hypothetical protein